MNKLSAREYTEFARRPTERVRNSRQERPSNQVDLESSVTGEVGNITQGDLCNLVRYSWVGF
jgi:hypothetical protein